jgi:AraC-like DNA-binding protein
VFVQAAHKNHYVTKHELATDKAARPVRWIAPMLARHEHVLRGNIGFLDLQEGLSVHFSNAEDLHDLKIETECGPRLCVAIFLEGSVDARVGAFRIPMPNFDEAAQHWEPVATVYSQTEPERFVRLARRGVCLKKVTITISPSWLQKFSLGENSDFAKIRDFATCHLASRTWRPSSHAVALAEQIINAPATPDFLTRIYVESRVLGLVEEGFREICDAEKQRFPGNLRSHDRQRLQAVEEYLNAHPGELVSADRLAAGVGLSANTLQRLLTNTMGLSTSRYIRWYMLEKARQALERDKVSIAEAAYLAGYSSPANFTTAFKRCFGLTPSAVQDR